VRFLEDGMRSQPTYIQAYFQGLSTAARDSIYRDPQKFREIQAAIKKKGVWEETTEWRISTETRSRIEAVPKRGELWYKVTSTCDATMTCECPTLERAYEFYWIFAQLHTDLFSAVGWPSWASAGQLRTDSSG
jgi:hypothetical protein